MAKALISFLKIKALTKPNPCDPGGTRTPNLLGRNQVLYPIEPRDRF